MVEVFREVRRVLRDDGTLWLNIGDSYAGSWGAQGHRGTAATLGRNQINNHPKRASNTGSVRGYGCKPKDLIGIPWMLAFALRADGWYLRQDIIWSKPNPMPESVRYRCTKAHEYLFLLSKGPRYFFDSEGIAEPAECDRGPGNTKPYTVPGQREGANANKGGSVHKIGKRDTRNKRSVWNVTTKPFAEAHFATFPPDLIEPCVLAGCPRGGVVLDPFFGAGTTGLVAQRLQRDCIGIELNPEYAEMARDRIRRGLGKVECELPENAPAGPLFDGMEVA
jgi:DNA modification methylase